MKFNLKTGLLVLLLVVPVFVFLFFKFFGKNHFKLPVYFATDSTLVDGRYVITEAHEVPEFKLTNQDKVAFVSDSLKGKIYVADFFFTRCPGICPQMTNHLKRVEEEFKQDANIRIISFTVDPKNDSAEVLKKYAQDFNVETTKWNFLTGPKDSIYNLAQKGFFLSAQEDLNKPLDFLHSEKLVLVDKEGRIRGYYNGTNADEIERLITEINVLKHEYAEN